MVQQVEAQPAPTLAAGPRGLSRLLDVLLRALEIYVTILMVGMAIIVLAGVFYRYVLQRALPWYDEFAEFLLVWLTFYGSVLVTYRGGHIGFETLLEYVPARVQRVLARASDVIVLLVQVGLVYYGWKLVQAASFDTAISIRAVRLSWIYSAIPISAAITIAIMTLRLARAFRAEKT